MPLTKISMRAGRSENFKKSLMHELYLAMHETFDVPENDYFMSITEHEDDTFSFGQNYLNINRSDDLIMIQLSASSGRTVAQKKALFEAICARLSENLDVRPEDVFINLVETKPENWSFGMGKAQKAWGDHEMLKDATISNATDAKDRPGKLSLWL